MRHGKRKKEREREVEVDDSREMSRTEKRVTHNRETGKKRCSVPERCFEERYPDPDTHRVAHELIKISCSSIDEHANRESSVFLCLCVCFLPLAAKFASH